MSRLIGKLGWNCCRADCWFQQCLAPLNTLTLKRSSKTGAFRHPGNHISRNQWLWKYLIYEADLYFQHALNLMDIAKMESKLQKMFSGFDHVAGIYLNYDGNRCDWHSTCYQTVLRFQIWIKETFSNSICLGLMEN